MIPLSRMRHESTVAAFSMRGRTFSSLASRACRSFGASPGSARSRGRAERPRSVRGIIAQAHRARDAREVDREHRFAVADEDATARDAQVERDECARRTAGCAFGLGFTRMKEGVGW